MSQKDFEQICKNGNFDLVKKMASNDYDYEYILNWGLHYAAIGGHINIIQFLIEEPCTVD